MSRDIDLDQRDRSTGSSQGSRGSGDAINRPTDELRQVFARELDLPRGVERERVWSRTKAHDLSRDDVGTLATVGAFRVVPANKLDRDVEDVRHLRDSGLVRTVPHVVGHARTALITLTEQGRPLLEDARRSTSHPTQVFYAGIVKSKDPAHDSRLYEAYLRSAERLTTAGARSAGCARLRAEARLSTLPAGAQSRTTDSSGRSTRDAEEVNGWAQDHDLTVVDGHVQFPDVRIEYDDRGHRAVEDVEVTTPHYRGAQLARKDPAGFSCYRASGARIGGTRGSRGGSPSDPRVCGGLPRMTFEDRVAR